jgi:hypothetical protein
VGLTSMHLPLRKLVFAGLAVVGVAALPAQTPQVKPGLPQTILLNAYADNWCVIFINGKLVATDSIDFLPHNQISVRILPEYPMTIAVLAKDNADPNTGLEYGNKIGDGGFALKLGDGTVSSSSWKAKSFFRGPLNGNIASPRVETTPIPANWFAVDFDDSAWSNATEYASDRVKPDGDYVATDFTNAKFIWTSDLDLDNTVIFRTRVAAPAGWTKAWNTTPELDISKLPGELGALVSTTTVATGTSDGTGQFTNLSARAQVGTADGVLVPGLVIGGATPRRVLVRAIGPALGAFGVTGFLADPTLTVFRGTTTLASNDNWQEQTTTGGATVVSTTAVEVGAFALPAGSKDSALVLTLEPGAYTFRVAGAGGTTGVALVEIYALP